MALINTMMASAARGSRMDHPQFNAMVAKHMRLTWPERIGATLLTMWMIYAVFYEIGHW